MNTGLAKRPQVALLLYQPWSFRYGRKARFGNRGMGCTGKKLALSLTTNSLRVIARLMSCMMEKQSLKAIKVVTPSFLRRVILCESYTTESVALQADFLA